MYRYMYIRGPYFQICVRVFLRYTWQTAVPTPKLPVCLSKRPPHAKKHPLLGQRFHPKAYMHLQRREQNHDTASKRRHLGAPGVTSRHTCKRRPARGSCFSGATADLKAVMPAPRRSIDWCKWQIYLRGSTLYNCSNPFCCFQA